MTHCEQVREFLRDRKPLVVGALAGPETPGGSESDCDIIELRLDSLGHDADVLDLAKNSPLPLLITARGQIEGGQSDWSIEKRAAAYRALMAHASLIDIELRDFDDFAEVIEEAKSLGIVVVGSFHHFHSTPQPDTLLEKLDRRADIHKFALMAETVMDISAHLSIFEQLPDHPLSVMGMGPLGAAARPLMAKAGSLLNYGYLGGTPTAPNQWPARLLKETLEV